MTIKTTDVAIIMGSDSDLPVVEAAFPILESFGINYTKNVLSAHRTPHAVIDFINKSESNRMQAKTRVLYEREKEKEICQLKESVNDLMNEKEIYREKLQCVEREAKLKEQKNIKAIEGKDGEIMELHTALSNIKVSLKEQESQNIELKTTLKGEKARQESEVEEMKKSRQQELDEIEGKVKNIVEDRDTRYQSALDRALCAEKELNRYETMFSNIEDGLGSVSREIIEGKDHY